MYAQENSGVKKVSAPSRNPSKCPITCFAPDKKNNLQDFQNQRYIGILIFLCERGRGGGGGDRERERERERDRVGERKRESESRSKKEKEREIERTKALTIRFLDLRGQNEKSANP
jgi:hypothetical protein